MYIKKQKRLIKTDLSGISCRGLERNVVTMSIDASNMKEVAIDCLEAAPRGIKIANPQIRKNRLKRSASRAILQVPLFALIFRVGLLFDYI